MNLLLSPDELALREEQARAERDGDRLLAERLQQRAKERQANERGIASFSAALRARFAKDSYEI